MKDKITSNHKFLVYLTDFKSFLIDNPVQQEVTLEALAHLMATAQRTNSDLTPEEMLDDIRKEINHYGVSPRYIGKRVINAYTNNQLFNNHNYEDQCLRSAIFKDIQHTPEGVDLGKRMEIFEKKSYELMKKEYDRYEKPPDDLIHVSCSGYGSPSPAQRIVAEKNWNTTVTHSYHMGCYGAFPALRMAEGFIASSSALGRPKSQVDIFHTEYLTLHANIRDLSPHNILTITLFGDGFIKYTVCPSTRLSSAEQRGLGLLALHEEIIPGTDGEMSWQLGPSHFEMYLSSRVPVCIGNMIVPFVKKLAEKAKINLEDLKDQMVFAIHPGGPKIIDFIQKKLELKDQQIHLSRKVLYENGNMSSATIPYVLKGILEEKSIEKGALVMALAFGPGLTACGALLEKV